MSDPRHAGIPSSNSDSDGEARGHQAEGGARAPLVGLAGIEPALAALLAEWLAEARMQALPGLSASSGLSSVRPEPIDLVVVDIPFPRQGAPALLQGLAQAWPHAPILALSATFLASVAARGAVARELGVASVMAKPVNREAWLAEVRRLLNAGAGRA